MADAPGDDARLLHLEGGEDDSSQEDVRGGGLGTRGLLRFLLKGTGLAFALVLAALALYFSIVPGADLKAEAVVDNDHDSQLGLFESVKYCSGCECSCEAYQNMCNIPSFSPAGGECCRDCCCNFHTTTTRPRPEVNLQGIGEGIHRAWSGAWSWLRIFLVVLVLAAGLWFFMKVVYPSKPPPPPPVIAPLVTKDPNRRCC